MDTVFFPLSKILWQLVRPDVWLLLLIFVAIVALLLKRTRLSLYCLSLTALGYLAIGIFPIADPFLRPLEAYAPANPEIAAPAGIVVLGGGEEADRTVESGLPALNDAGERFIAAIDLARRFPEAKVIFTGGTGLIRQDPPPGSVVAQMIFEQAGISNDRMILEGDSRNTWQNAVYTLPLVEDAVESGPFVLVTSAFHMRRSLATFCAAGWRNLIGYPTDFRAMAGHARVGWQFTGHLRDLELTVKEWIGLLAYHRSGRAQDPTTTESCLADGHAIST